MEATTASSTSSSTSFILGSGITFFQDPRTFSALPHVVNGLVQRERATRRATAAGATVEAPAIRSLRVDLANAERRVDDLLRRLEVSSETNKNVHTFSLPKSTLAGDSEAEAVEDTVNEATQRAEEASRHFYASRAKLRDLSKRVTEAKSLLSSRRRDLTGLDFRKRQLTLQLETLRALTKACAACESENVELREIQALAESIDALESMAKKHPDFAPHVVQELSARLELTKDRVVDRASRQCEEWMKGGLAHEADEAQGKNLLACLKTLRSLHVALRAAKKVDAFLLESDALGTKESIFADWGMESAVLRTRGLMRRRLMFLEALKEMKTKSMLEEDKSLLRLGEFWGALQMRLMSVIESSFDWSAAAGETAKTAAPTSEQPPALSSEAPSFTLKSRRLIQSLRTQSNTRRRPLCSLETYGWHTRDLASTCEEFAAHDESRLLLDHHERVVMERLVPYVLSKSLSEEGVGASSSTPDWSLALTQARARLLRAAASPSSVACLASVRPAELRERARARCRARVWRATLESLKRRARRVCLDDVTRSSLERETDAERSLALRDPILIYFESVAGSRAEAASEEEEEEEETAVLIEACFDHCASSFDEWMREAEEEDVNGAATAGGAETDVGGLLAVHAALREIARESLADEEERPEADPESAALKAETQAEARFALRALRLYLYREKFLGPALKALRANEPSGEWLARLGKEMATFLEDTLAWQTRALRLYVVLPLFHLWPRMLAREAAKRRSEEDAEAMGRLRESAFALRSVGFRALQRDLFKSGSGVARLGFDRVVSRSDAPWDSTRAGGVDEETFERWFPEASRRRSEGFE